MLDVAVIGGGISGLATAHGLMSRGLDVTVLERQVVAGGNAISERFDGWLMEHGPTTLNAAFLRSGSLVEQVGLDQKTLPLGPGVRRRYLRDGSKLSGISTNPFGFFMSGYLSPLAKLSLVSEVLRPRRTDNAEESLHDFACRRFGTAFAERVIDPMAAGIFMGDAKMLSVTGAFPRLVEMEARFGSVMRAVLAAKMRRGVEPGRRLFSWGEGIGSLPRQLAASLGHRLKTGVAVTRVRQAGHGFSVSTVEHGTVQARAVVLAVPAHVSAALSKGVDPEGAEALSEIEAPPVAVAFLGYRRDQVEHPLDGLGFLSTKTAGQIVSGVQFPSTMFSGRAPSDYVALSAYVGGRRAFEMATRPQAELLEAIEQELRPLLGIKGSPEVARVRYWPRGLPQYEMGHADRRTVIHNSSNRVPGFWVAGNFINGVSVTNCLEQAANTAAGITAHFELKGNQKERFSVGL